MAGRFFRDSKLMNHGEVHAKLEYDPKYIPDTKL